MSHIIIEIKAKCNDHEPLRKKLIQHNARFVGVDHQTDTYFRVQSGRLKLREGNIEHTLIRYHRPNQEGPKQSDVTLYKPKPDPALKQILVDVLGVLVVVRKVREIYFVDNVKIHLDNVDPLGSFAEIEAIDMDGDIGKEKLQQQCEYWMQTFTIQQEDLIDRSYSDMLLEQTGL